MEVVGARADADPAGDDDTANSTWQNTGRPIRVETAEFNITAFTTDVISAPVWIP